MEDFNRVIFGDTPQINPQKEEEKKKIKKVSALIGAAFIAMYFVPEILNSLLSDIIRIVGPTKEVITFINDPAVSLLLQIIFSFLTCTLPFLILPIGLGKKTAQLVNLNKPNWGLFIAFTFVGVGISAFANIASNELGAIFEAFGVHFSSPRFNYPTGVFGMLLSYLAIAVTPALVEEFAMRGMVMGTARPHGELFGLIVSATLFSLMHGNLVQIPFAFVMGIIIGYAVIKSGSIITGMTIHFLNNAISVTMAYTMSKIESFTVQGICSIAYVGICAVLLIAGLFLAQKIDRGVWYLNKGESLLTDREKFKIFFLSPTVIVSVILTVVECMGTITLG